MSPWPACSGPPRYQAAPSPTFSAGLSSSATKTRCDVLATHPDSTPQMLAVVRRMFADNRTSGSVRDTIELALSLGDHPGPGRGRHPAPGQGFDLARFISQNGTLYLIASGDEDSPGNAAVPGLHLVCALRRRPDGHPGPAGRLDPPLRMALDEVTTICPVDLPTMLSDSAGKGILITAVAHGTSQLKERWGEHGGQTVWDTCGTKILLGGISDAETLRQASEMCGSVILGEPGEQPPVPVVPPELIRALPDWRALVIRMNLSPVVVKIRPAWKRLGHRLRFVPAYDPRPGRHGRSPRLGRHHAAGASGARQASCPRTGLPTPGRSPLRT